MLNKTLIFILFISLIGMIISLLLMSFSIDSYNYILDICEKIFILTGIYLLVKNGTFIKSRQFRFIGLGFAVIIIGSMFKIMHWVNGNLIFSGGLGLVLLIYLFHFIRKPEKNIIDIGKLVFLVTFLLSFLLKGMRWLGGTELTFLSTIVLILIVVYFIRSGEFIREEK